MNASNFLKYGPFPSTSLSSQSYDIGWDAVQKELRDIDHGQAPLEAADLERSGRSTAVTRSHWKPQEQCTNCANPACKKKFGALDRKLHCRRCGKVFCDACTKFKRKLSVDAKPDPSGTPQRVCEKCYDQGPQGFGAARNWKSFFVASRDAQRLRQHQSSSLGKPTSGSRLGVKDELRRLLLGFDSSAGSWLKSTVAELKSPLSVPDWQRSQHWENAKAVTSCYVCQTRFGILATKHHCKVCGRVVCKSCGADDLLLFLNASSREICWALYGLEGCPVKEPIVRLYLRCCHTCKQLLQPMKAEQLDTTVKTDFMGDLAKVHDELCGLQDKLDKQLPIFQEHVDSLSIDQCSPRAGPSGTSPIKQLAKSQMDVSDCITRYGLLLNQKVGRMRPVQKVHVTVLSRIAQSKMLYYRERLFLFRALRRCLADTTPPEVLELVQSTVELQTITNVYIVMRQLSLEVLHITENGDLDMELLEALMALQRDEVCSRDMQHAVERCAKIGQDESWEEHLKYAKELTSMCVKGKDSRVVKVHLWPRSLGKSQLQVRLILRSFELVAQVHRELEAKSSGQRFQASKESIGLLKVQLEASVPKSRYSWEH